MTNPDYTAIAVLMDRSGSMMSIREDAEGAIAAFITDQAKVPGQCTIRLSQFDTEYSSVYESVNIADAPHYSLVPRGGTALLDGIGRLVTEFGEELADMAEDRRPAKVIVVVQTDGEENSSQEWTRERIFELISSQQDLYGWAFVFLGANQDAISVGASMGFKAGSSMTYASTAAGTQAAGSSLSNYTTATRSGMVAEFTDEERAAASK